MNRVLIKHVGSRADAQRLCEVALNMGWKLVSVGYHMSPLHERRLGDGYCITIRGTTYNHVPDGWDA